MSSLLEQKEKKERERRAGHRHGHELTGKVRKSRGNGSDLIPSGSSFSIICKSSIVEQG